MKCAFITGGSGGIGRAVTGRMLRGGWHVVNFDRQPPQNDAAEFIEIDLLQSKQLAERIAEHALRHQPQALINIAATGRPATFLDTTLEDFMVTCQVNLVASAIFAQAVLPAMREAGHGRIIHFSSRAATGKIERAAYGASKAAIEGLTRTMALEFAADGITVNAIAPGPIATAAFERANPPGSENRKMIEATIPVRRLGRPEEVASLVEWLASDETGFITGQVIAINGGMA